MAEATTSQQQQQKRERPEKAGEEEEEAPASKKREEEQQQQQQQREGRRKRVAVVFGYVGAGYHGLQVAGDARLRTVEGDLHAALVRAGAIGAANAGSFQRACWSRCARTDKGVSAAANVVGLNWVFRFDASASSSSSSSSSQQQQQQQQMSTEDEEAIATAMVARVNKELEPAAIRVFGVRRVTGGFDAKGRCSGRTYRYVLPISALRLCENGTACEHEQAEAEAEAEATAEKEDTRSDEELVGWLQAALGCFVGVHNFHNFTLGRDPWERSCERHVTSAGVVGVDYKGGGGGEGQEQQQGPIKRVAIGEGDGEATMSEPFVTVEITGQSFMLLQIRKMVGFVVLLARAGVGRGAASVDEVGAAVKTIFEEACLRPRIGIPAAPAAGLFLDRPHFDQYNARFAVPVHSSRSAKAAASAAATSAAAESSPAKAQPQGVRGAVRVEDWEDEVRRFRDTVIVPHAAREMAVEGKGGIRHFVALLDKRLAMGYVQVTPRGVVTPIITTAATAAPQQQQQQQDEATAQEQPQTAPAAATTKTSMAGADLDDEEEAEIAAALLRRDKKKRGRGGNNKKK